MDPLSAIRDTFFQACGDLLADLESGLLAIAEGGTDPKPITAGSP